MSTVGHLTEDLTDYIDSNLAFARINSSFNVFFFLGVVTGVCSYMSIASGSGYLGNIALSEMRIDRSVEQSKSSLFLTNSRK